MTKTYIDGPTNVVRLHNKNKIIYIFFDFHIQPNYQTRCEDINSQPISTFLVSTFNNLKTKTDKIYDFMVERSPLYPSSVNFKKRGKYIDEIMYLFNKSFNINLDESIVNPSLEIPNVRFHWTDTRDYIIKNTMDIVENHIPSIIFALKNVINIISLTRLCDLLNMVNGQMINLYNIIYNTPDLQNPKIDKYVFSINNEILSEYSEEEYANIRNKIIYKLLKSYKNKDIHKKMLYIINNDLHNIFIEFFNFTTKSLDKLEHSKEKIMLVNNNILTDTLLPQFDGTYDYGLGIEEYNNYICLFNTIQSKMYDHIILEIGLYLMDLYLLRRFLDKEYITNTITYTGASHSLNYIRLLVKYFDFKITDCSYIKDNDIANATKKIKKSHKYEELKEFFYSPRLLQCSNMSGFPKLFE
jgi:hypothetical protein